MCLGYRTQRIAGSGFADAGHDHAVAEQRDTLIERGAFSDRGSDRLTERFAVAGTL